MAWRTISEAEFLLEGFNPTEKTAITNVAGGDEGLTELLTSGIAQWRGVIEAAGNELGAAGAVPDAVRPYLVAQLRWQLLIKFPSLRALQTQERKEAYERAEEIIDKIADVDFPIEAAEEQENTSAGNWNADPKIRMSTSDGTRANEEDE